MDVELNENQFDSTYASVNLESIPDVDEVEKTSLTDISDFDTQGENQNKSLLDKVKSLLPSNKEKNENISSNNKIRKVIIFLLGLFAFYILLDHFFPTEDTNETIAVISKPVPAYKKNLKKKQTEEKKETAEKSEKISESPKVDQSLDQSSVVGDSSIDPVTSDQITADTKPNDLDFSTQETPSLGTGETTSELSVGTTEDVSEIKHSETETINESILDDLENQVKKQNKNENSVKEYVSPPNYEYFGRGLVYNCLGKHWACVDGPSYKACEDNASSVKYLGKKTECYPFNVYETTSGCEYVQNRMVSSSAKTNFCNE